MRNLNGLLIIILLAALWIPFLMGQSSDKDQVGVTVGSGPGSVPVGGLVPIYNTIAYTPPASGVIDEFGFMICDGSGTIPVGANPAIVGDPIPALNNSNQFLRGNSSPAGTGGSLDHNLVSANMPSGVYSGYTTAAVFEHSHADSFSVSHSVTGTFAHYQHKHRSPLAYSGGYLVEYCAYGTQGTTPTTGIYGSAGTGTGDICLTQTPSATGSVSNGTPVISGSVGADNITTNRTVTITGGQADPTNIPTVPPYTNVVWLIRVK